MHFDRNWIEQPDEATAKEPVVRPFADRSDSSSVPGHKNKEGRQQVLQSKISCCEKAPKERRGSMRMPIERDVSYKVRGLTAGSGKTVNISSGGVLFTTESPLLEGAEVEL